ncbi:NADP-dependent L-serine/L-allo-threonine dehydrogenase ydfG [Periconia macrospinosa]|uniref:NADP-dependent L-serine/L-allo-threonine dehydrogenase ydfG n=1 Tax=Periconia macrospinosa TaxID=97972 RepID=A0A2V1DHR9_9PLEO|nr:NADP-dependent L-serine/L-allo-threonine dehydrogenase ydfG [Periconia macrospinosa]
MSLKDKTVLITGASMGIGAAIAHRLAREQATLILFARSKDKLDEVASRIQQDYKRIKVYTQAVDVSSDTAVTSAIESAVQQLDGRPIDVLVNNAGLALGAPSAFPDLSISDVITMTGTNVHGMLFTTYAVLNQGKMKENGRGTILNVTSTTALEVPPFPGESIYHASKAFQEGFTNALRTELVGTNIKVLALRPGVVATHFHEQRVGFSTDMYDSFMEGFEPLVSGDVAEAAAWMLQTEERVSVKAVDVVPTAQRGLPVFDREWNSRNGI